jgi:excisionase family DNA binding protein
MPSKKATQSQPEIVTPLLVDLRTAATILCTSLSTVRKLVRTKKIRHVKLGKRWQVSPADLQQFVSRELSRTAAIVIFLGLFLLPAAKAQTVPNRFHYGAEYKTTIGEQARSFRTAYCNTDGQEVGSLTVTAFTTGVGDVSLIPEHASNIDERDVRVERTYETAAQAKRAGEKYAAVVFNHAWGIGK